MIIVLLMASAMASPLVFQGLWYRKGFRAVWWIGLGFMVLVLASSVLGPYLGNGSPSAPVAKPLPTADEFFAPTPKELQETREKLAALGACKSLSLQNWRADTASPEGQQNFFDACMQARNYQHASRPECFAGYAGLPNNPAYNYVTGYFDVDQRGIFDCYAKA